MVGKDTWFRVGEEGIQGEKSAACVVKLIFKIYVYIKYLNNVLPLS